MNLRMKKSGEEVTQKLVPLQGCQDGDDSINSFVCLRY